MSFGPVVPSAGPIPSRIVLLAEAPGSEESAKLTPLVGPSGWELRRMLKTIGVNLDDCYKCNVFSRQPQGNNLALYGVPKGHPDAMEHLGPLTLNPILYLSSAHWGEVQRVHQELAAVDPNVIIALGNTATWALGLGLGISAIRGSVHLAEIPGMSRPVKVLPTYHPAMVLRQWDSRTIAIADLQKALNESHSPNLHFDNTELWLSPTLEDLAEFGERFMENATVVAADIETKRDQITCLSFAPSPDVAVVVPFWVKDSAGPNYWADVREEATAWRWVQKWMEKPTLAKVFQNGLFDLQYLMAFCSPRNCTEDTMLMSHSLWSELPKGLGFLGSLHANYPAWKKMRRFIKEEALKRDD